MSLVKKCLKTLGFLSFLAVSNTYATDITFTNTSVDDRAPANDIYSHGSESIYGINQMDISWGSNNILTVDVLTNFDHTQNNEHWYKGKAIVFGDLLISAGQSAVSNGNFNYAFSLGNDRFTQSSLSNSSNGGVYKIDGTTKSQDYHRNRRSKAYRQGDVFGDTTGGKIGSTNLFSVGSGKLTFKFDLSSLFGVGKIYENSKQLAFSWAMSCFNDNVHSGLVSAPNSPIGNPPKDVPEPATIFIMLLALAGLVFIRRKQANTFSA